MCIRDRKPTSKYDAVIVAVSHTQYAKLDEAYFKELLSDKGIVVDIKGLYRDKIKGLTYWSL
jgi:UDP-N-acetyl-D-galactosamine dehydrogenase